MTGRPVAIPPLPAAQAGAAISACAWLVGFRSVTRPTRHTPCASRRGVKGAQGVPDRLVPPDMPHHKSRASAVSIVDDRFGVAYAVAVCAVGVAVPGDGVLQDELVDLVVALGLDPVGVGLAVLAEQDQWGGVGGLGGEEQVEQDERVGIPAVQHGDDVDGYPERDDSGLDDGNRQDPNTEVTESARRCPDVR